MIRKFQASQTLKNLNITVNKFNLLGFVAINCLTHLTSPSYLNQVLKLWDHIIKVSFSSQNPNIIIWKQNLVKELTSSSSKILLTFVQSLDSDMNQCP